MCATLKHSIYNVIINFISSLLLFYIYKKKQLNKDILIIILFFLFISLMQIYDVIFWLNQKENNINYIFTKIAMITNQLQPIIFTYLISLYYKLNDTTILILILYIFFSLYYCISIFNKINYTLVTKESYPVLDWKWNNFYNSQHIYILFVLLLSLCSSYFQYPLNIISIIFTNLSLLFSYYYYKKYIGKVWCIIAVYFPLLILIIKILKS
jgi:hypothetical protein